MHRSVGCSHQRVPQPIEDEALYAMGTQAGLPMNDIRLPAPIRSPYPLYLA